MNKSLAASAKAWAVMILGAVLMGLNYEFFIFPNAFAPAGFHGIATMVQYLFHISIGYFSALINLPLLILAWRRVDRVFTVRTTVFVVVFSLVTLFLNSLDLSAWVYHTDNGTSTILGPITAGLINGAIYSIVFRNNGSTGGTDIIAALIREKHPEASLMWVIFSLNAFVALLSFFVYDYRFEPVILCLFYSYISSFVSNNLMKLGKRALKFEVVTERGDALAAALRQELHHGVTVLSAEGSYSGDRKALLICVVNRHQLVRFHEVLARFPGVFAYVSDVNETMGNFQKTALERHTDRVPRDYLS